MAECWYWTRKLRARYLCGDYTTAMAAAARAQALLGTSSSFFEEAEYHFYAALAAGGHLRAAPRRTGASRIWTRWPCIIGSSPTGPGTARRTSRTAPRWSAPRSPACEGRLLDAEHGYEQAIGAAQTSGFVHIEALANELASRFYAARGLEKIARIYLRDARYGYLRWGADGKVRQLEAQFPYLRADDPAPGPTSTIATPVEHLDLATVLKVSQAASGDIVLENLIDMIMRTAIEQAGAERGLLVLSGAGEHRVAAEATTGTDATRLQLRDVEVSAEMLPESLLFHVLRTRRAWCWMMRRPIRRSPSTPMCASIVPARSCACR